MARKVTQEDIQYMNDLYYLHRSYTEVAKQSGWSVATVRKYIVRITYHWTLKHRYILTRTRICRHLMRFWRGSHKLIILVTCACYQMMKRKKWKICGRSCAHDETDLFFFGRISDSPRQIHTGSKLGCSTYRAD